MDQRPSSSQSPSHLPKASPRLNADRYPTHHHHVLDFVDTAGDGDDTDGMIDNVKLRVVKASGATPLQSQREGKLTKKTSKIGSPGIIGAANVTTLQANAKVGFLIVNARSDAERYI
ncbi:hypothetical protein FRB97_004159 [Tulasnella sp. 331]|nr:hypothetical protein FRB97_004159 [Tulasnella sp. 331]